MAADTSTSNRTVRKPKTEKRLYEPSKITEPEKERHERYNWDGSYQRKTDPESRPYTKAGHTPISGRTLDIPSITNPQPVANTIDIPATFPEAFSELFNPARMKIYYGGRGGAKSTSFAKALLLMGHQTKKRVLCVREFQASISDSVHRLLSDCIFELGLDEFYTIEKQSIKGANGTEFTFSGIATNVSKIRSFAGADICWLEEASNVSQYSLSVLLPTIREKDSEIWISFNPELETDPIWQLVTKPRPNSIVRKVNYDSNPFFTEPLVSEMLHDKERDYDAYRHVWLGEFRKALEGTVYATELREAEEQMRITSVPYDPTIGVSCFFDLGWADATSIILAQKVGYEYHIIDYIEGTRQSIEDYVRLIQAKEYCIDTMYLPHDARAKHIGTGKSVEELIRNKGFKTIIVPNLSLTDGINACRTVFPQFYFDKERCADLLYALNRYAYDKQPDHLGGFRDKPAHSRYSHAADALRYCAVSLRPSSVHEAKAKTAFRRDPMLYSAGGDTGWMSL